MNWPGRGHLCWRATPTHATLPSHTMQDRNSLLSDDCEPSPFLEARAEPSSFLQAQASRSQVRSCLQVCVQNWRPFQTRFLCGVRVWLAWCATHLTMTAGSCTAVRTIIRSTLPQACRACAALVCRQHVLRWWSVHQSDAWQRGSRDKLLPEKSMIKLRQLLAFLSEAHWLPGAKGARAEALALEARTGYPAPFNTR